MSPDGIPGVHLITLGSHNKYQGSVVKYRVTIQVTDPGCADLVLRFPLAGGPLQLATGTYCPSMMREHAKSESTQPRSEN